eukprot:3151681-Rhodomonas_salina.1
MSHSEIVAAAFRRGLAVHPETLKRMTAHYATKNQYPLLTSYDCPNAKDDTKPSTERGYGAIRRSMRAGCVWRRFRSEATSYSAKRQYGLPFCLRKCYAMSSTEIAYAASCYRSRYAMSGTEIANGASGCLLSSSKGVFAPKLGYDPMLCPVLPLVLCAARS